MSNSSPYPKRGVGGWPVFYDTEGRVFLTSEAERAPHLSAASTIAGHAGPLPAAPQSSHHGRHPTLPLSRSNTLRPVETPPQQADHHPNSHIGRNRPPTDLITPTGSKTTPNPSKQEMMRRRCSNCREVGHNRTSCQKMHCCFCGEDNHMWRKCDKAARVALQMRLKIRERKARKETGFL